MAALQNLMTLSDRDALEIQIGGMKDDLADIKGSMSKVAQALTTLAVLEERHQTVAAATNKILSRIEKMEERQIIMDKREFAITDLSRKMEEISKKVDLKEARVQALENEKNIQDGKIRGATNTIRIIWAVLAGSGLTVALIGLLLS